MIVASSPSSGAAMVPALHMRLSPSVRSARFCHSSSVMKGMKGWSRCNRWSKKRSTSL